jgi:hypothetical protein
MSLLICIREASQTPLSENYRKSTLTNNELDISILCQIVLDGDIIRLYTWSEHDFITVKVYIYTCLKY